MGCVFRESDTVQMALFPDLSGSAHEVVCGGGTYHNDQQSWAYKGPDGTTPQRQPAAVERKEVLKHPCPWRYLYPRNGRVTMAGPQHRERIRQL